MAMANVKGKGRLSEILGTGAHRRPTHYRSSARLTHAERRARKTVVDLSAMPERVDQQAELDAAVLAGIKHRDSVLVDKRRRATNRRFMDQGGGNDYYERVWDAASPRERQIARSHFDTTLLRKCLLAWHMQAVHDNIERHERELNAILKHHQIHLYGQKDKKYLMVQSSFDAWKIMVHHNRRVRALRRRRRELEAKRPPPQKNRGHGAFRKMGKSPKSSPTPPRRRLDSTPDAIRRKLLTMTDAHELFHVGTGAHHDQSPEKLGQSGRWETKRFGGYHPKLQAIENGDDVPETNDDDDDGDDDDDDDDTSKKVVEGIPEIGHRPLLQRGEGHSSWSRSVREICAPVPPPAKPPKKRFKRRRRRRKRRPRRDDASTVETLERPGGPERPPKSGLDDDDDSTALGTFDDGDSDGSDDGGRGNASMVSPLPVSALVGVVPDDMVAAADFFLTADQASAIERGGEPGPLGDGVSDADSSPRAQGTVAAGGRDAGTFAVAPRPPRGKKRRPKRPLRTSKTESAAVSEARLPELASRPSALGDAALAQGVRQAKGRRLPTLFWS